MLQGNMLLDDGGGVLVADLGAAQRGIQKGKRTNEMAAEVATDAYLPPEILHYGESLSLLSPF